MFTNCEQWRKDFGVDEINRTFKFDEKPLVSVYYPQYYHKTDKVFLELNRIYDRMDVQFTLNNLAKWI
jgi:hypothetical protein